MSERALRGSPIRRLMASTAVSASILLAMLSVLAGCNFWAAGPEGEVALVTIPDQEALAFLNRFSAGLAQLHAILDPLDEPRLAGLLQQLEASFRELDRNIARNSPAHPVNLGELQQRLAALTEALVSQSSSSAKLRPALAQARELQQLIADLAARVQADLGLAPSIDGDEDRAPAPASPGPSYAFWYASSDGSITRVTVSAQEVTAFLSQFNSLVDQVSMILNALNAPPLLRLLEQVKASFRKVQGDIERGSPANPVAFTELSQRLALLAQTVTPYPCRGTRSRTILDQHIVELQGLVERFSLKIQAGLADGRLSRDGQGDDSTALRAHIAGGNRVICLEDPQFSAQGSTGPIVQYLWDFGDGHTATGFTVDYEYRRPGHYTVILTVVDREGHTAKASILVVVRSC